MLSEAAYLSGDIVNRDNVEDTSSISNASFPRFLANVLVHDFAADLPRTTSAWSVGQQLLDFMVMADRDEKQCRE
jgi:hypothetical protein